MLFSLPEDFEKIAEPKFVLYAPVGLQLLTLGLTLVVPAITFFWIYRIAQSGGTLLAAHWFLAGIFAIMLIVPLYPRSWKLWVGLAVNLEGFYLPNRNLELRFIPWTKIKDVYVGPVSAARSSQRGIVLKTSLTDGEFKKMFGTTKQLQRDKDGFLLLGVGNNAQDPESALSEIARIRRLVPGQC